MTKWRSVEPEFRLAWNKAEAAILETRGTQLCPSCSEAELRFYWSRPAGARSGAWLWCPACRRFDHGSGRAPAWWKLPSEAPTLEELEPEPTVLDARWSSFKVDFDPPGLS